MGLRGFPALESSGRTCSRHHVLGDGVEMRGFRRGEVVREMVDTASLQHEITGLGTQRRSGDEGIVRR